MSHERASVNRRKVLSVCVWATLGAATSLGIMAVASVVRDAGPPPWPPEYSYLSKIPFARDGLGRWP